MESRKEAAKSSAACSRIAAVVVTFNPSLDGLERLLDAVTSQVDRVFVVDNGSANAFAINELGKTRSQMTFTALGQNFGIGRAQNVGFRLARVLGASFVLTLDQDSVPSEGMVRHLVSVHTSQSYGAQIAAVGPMLKDESSRQALPFFSYAEGRKTRITPTDSLGVMEVGFLVSSGTVIAMRALESIGLMREELFIAYVDVEFCLRARAAGFRILACCSASMDHNLGDKRFRIGRWMIPLHSPSRHFHLMRSGIYMQKLATVPAIWKQADRRQLIRSFLLFSLAGLPRLQEFSAMTRGLLAGFRLKVQPVVRFDAHDTPLV